MHQDDLISTQERRRLDSPGDVAAVKRDAAAGQGEALRLMALLAAAGFNGSSDWPEALDWMVAAAEAGEEEAQGELLMLCSDEACLRWVVSFFAAGEAFPAEVWRRLADGVDLPALLAAPSATLHAQDPLIGVAEDIVSPDFCAWMIGRARPFLAPATVLTPGGARPEVQTVRTNSTVQVRFASTGLPLLALRQRIANLVAAPVGQLETTNVLHYSPGQAFQPHFDGFAADTPVQNAAHAAQGQRLMTVLVYLNDDYEGGETAFPRLNLRFQGAAGQALFWRNTKPGGVELDPLTLHAGLPTTQGEKWIISQWVRENPVSIFLPQDASPPA